MTQASLNFNPKTEARARDRALDLLEAHRGDLVAISRELAMEICRERGRVSGPEVFAALKARGLSELLNDVDPRFMGAVFRNGWKRLGYENGGSHRRPVSIWTRRTA